MKEPWVIVSAGFHNTAGQAKAVTALASFLARNDYIVHLIGHDFDRGFLNSDRFVFHSVPRPFSVDAIGNLAIAAGRSIVKGIVQKNPKARVIVNGGNCVWADVNWVHYLHLAWRADLTLAPVWYQAKERLVNGWYRKMERKSLKAAQLVISNSKRTTRDIIHFGGVSPERVQTVYYGVDPTWIPPLAEEQIKAREMFGLHPNVPVVVFVGGFGHDNRKGFDTLIDTWRMLCKDPSWDPILVLAGSGKAESRIRSILEQDGLLSRVRMIGFTDQVFNLLAASDLLVSPVKYEPYGLNVQEAICRCVPAIVSRVAGIAETYPPELEEMILNDPENIEELYVILRKWRSNIPAWKYNVSRLSVDLRSRPWDRMSEEIVQSIEATKPAYRM